MDLGKVAGDEAKFSKMLLEVTLETVTEGEVNLDEIQIFSESVHFSEDADALKLTGMRESLRGIRNHYIGLAQDFHYLTTATLIPEQLRKAVTDLPLPLPVMSTPLTCATIHHDDEGAHQLMAIGQQKVEEAKMGHLCSYATLSDLYQVTKSTLNRMYSGESNLRGVQYEKYKAEAPITKSMSKEPKFEPTEVPVRRLRGSGP